MAVSLSFVSIRESSPIVLTREYAFENAHDVSQETCITLLLIRRSH